MTTLDQDLFNSLTRQAIYREGVKLTFIEQAEEYEDEIISAIISALLASNVSKLNELSVTRLRQLTADLRRKLLVIYGKSSKRTLRALRQLMAIEATAIDNIFDAHKVRRDDTPIGPDEKGAKLWLFVANYSMGATGQSVLEYIKQRSATAIANVILRVRQGAATGETIEQTRAALVGTRDHTLERKSSVIDRNRTVDEGVMRTAVQAVAAFTQAARASARMRRYRWVSVLDSRTSDICRSRANMIYIYGDGPVPPAHPNCRSYIVPLDDSAPLSNIPDIDDWMGDYEDLAEYFDVKTRTAKKQLSLTGYASKLSAR